jgi:hypothetical protein
VHMCFMCACVLVVFRVCFMRHVSARVACDLNARLYSRTLEARYEQTCMIQLFHLLFTIGCANPDSLPLLATD